MGAHARRADDSSQERLSPPRAPKPDRPGPEDASVRRYFKPLCVVFTVLFFALLLPGTSGGGPPGADRTALLLSAYDEARIARRAKARLDRLIRLAQDKKRSSGSSDKSPSGGSSPKKSPPPQTIKKEPAPKIKKAPEPKKAAPAPRIKKEPAPKKAGPAPRKIEPVKKTPPVLEKGLPKKEKPPETATEQQQQENKEFCAKNPNHPSCSKETAPPQQTTPTSEELAKQFCAKNPDSPKCTGKPDEPPPATEKICAVNPKYPGCGKLVTQPGLTRPPDGGGTVPSLCVQNPGLPQCQQGRPDETRPPQAGDGRPGRPGREPPEIPGTGPIPPGPPPPPPADSGGTTPSGPQIQTVDQCPPDQVAWGDQCIYPGNCPEGQVQYTDYSLDPPQSACGESCPDGMLERAGSCLGVGPCFQFGGVEYQGQCLAQCPLGTQAVNGRCREICTPGQVEYQNQCLDACPANTIQEGNTCVPGCPEGEFMSQAGVCAPAECPPGQFRDVDGQCVAQCGEGATPTYNQTNGAFCMQQCPEGQYSEFTRCVDQCGTGYDYVVDGQCLTSCPQDMVEHEGQCLAECPSGQVREGGTCIADCPEGQTYDYGDGTCKPNICPPGTFKNFNYDCVSECPEGSTPITGANEPYCRRVCAPGQLQEYVRCVDQCSPSYDIQMDGVCYASCPEEGTVQSGNQCVESCPDGQFHDLGTNMCVDSCPEGTGERDGQCQAIGENGCLGADVLLDGQCVARDQCYQGGEAGRVIHEGECRESCPGGRSQLGSMCLEECPEGFFEQDDRCRIYCPPDAAGPEWFFGACETCASGTSWNNYQCVNECPAGKVDVDGRCTGEGSACEPGEMLVDGQCTLTSEVSYEDFTNRCLAEINLENLPPGVQGSTSQEACDNFIDTMCGSAPGASGIRYCNERPCGEGLENVGGVCQPPAETPAPPGGGQPPPEGEQPPPEGEQPPPGTGRPPPPPPGAGIPPAPRPGKGMPPKTPAPVESDRKAPAELKAAIGYRAVNQPPLAVVISNADYKLKGVPDKPRAAEGAAAFASFLQLDMKLPPSRIIQLRDFGLRQLEAFLGKAETGASQLRTALAYAPAQELILYYAGNAMPVDNGADAVLLPVDGDPAKPAATGYRLSMLYKNLNSMGIERLRVYIDAGFSPLLGAQPARGMPAPRRVVTWPVIGPAGLQTPPHWAVITAGTGDAPVYTGPNQPRTAFNISLLAGLRGYSDLTSQGNHDGIVSAGELLGYLRARVGAVVNQNTGGTQVPALFGSRQEPLALYETILPQQPAPAPRPTPVPEKKSEAAEPERPAAPVKPVKPSFDCARARAKTEKAICANPEVAALDNEMVALYYKRRRGLRGSKRRALTQQQKRWLAQRNSCGADTACLIGVYQQRIQQLR